MAGDVYSWAIMVYEVLTGKHPFDWALEIDDKVKAQAMMKAIAANDRRGFVPIGDITMDSLIDACTADLRQRIRDIASANKILRQFVAVKISASIFGLFMQGPGPKTGVSASVHLWCQHERRHVIPDRATV